jgi:hypothetical protein
MAFASVDLKGVYSGNALAYNTFAFLVCLFLSVIPLSIVFKSVYAVQSAFLFPSDTTHAHAIQP